MSDRNLFLLLIILATVDTTCSMRNIYTNKELYPPNKEVSRRKITQSQKRQPNSEPSSLNQEALITRNQNVNNLKPTKLNPIKEEL